MQVKEISFFVVAFFIAVGVVNSTGLWTANNADISGYESTPDQIGITTNYSIASTSDLADENEGTGLVTGAYDVLSTMFSACALPAPYLKGLGLNTALADGIGVMIYLIYSWGILQFVMNRSGKGID